MSRQVHGATMASMSLKIRAQALDKLHAELTAERLGGLARAGEALSARLDELAAIRAELATLEGPARAEPLARYQRVREESETRRWYLVVQREAIGLYNHDDLEAVYPIPPIIDR